MVTTANGAPPPPQSVPSPNADRLLNRAPTHPPTILQLGRGNRVPRRHCRPHNRRTAAWQYEYFLRDHLGNNRILFADKNVNNSIETDEILQENHYYAFGMAMEGDWTVTPVFDQRYRYNGKEFSEELGLYDYGARWYDPATARWTSVDPLASSMASWSPYNYTFGNPVKYIDENGEFPILSGIVGAFKGLFANRSNFEPGANSRFGNVWRSGARYEKQAWKILGGLGVTDRDKSTGGKALQLLSRFTWELPNTALGVLTASTTNVVARVNDVDYEAGATVLQTDYYFGAFTIGSFIVGDASIEATFGNDLFTHEYGHYLQSQSFGPFYLPGFALPSVARATLWGAGLVGGKYDDFYTESNATRRGEKYRFDKLFSPPITDDKLPSIEDDQRLSPSSSHCSCFGPSTHNNP